MAEYLYLGEFCLKISANKKRDGCINNEVHIVVLYLKRDLALGLI